MFHFKKEIGRMLLNGYLAVQVALGLASCSSNDKVVTSNTTIFETGEIVATVTNPSLDEISGIATSYTNNGCFWVHNDSGDKARIFLINGDGQVIATVNIIGIEARDWEDIATAIDQISGIPYIYISETGDNQAQYENKYIYKIAEPQIDVNTLNQVISINITEKITFNYEDGKRDAETLFVESATGDIYVVSKREKKIHVYLLKYPQITTEPIIAQKVQTLPFNQATAGDISDDGTEILIKNYDNIYYWRRQPGETIAQTLSRVATIIPYIREPQGESITWLNDGSAFVTISETGREGITPKLYLYRKKESR